VGPPDLGSALLAIEPHDDLAIPLRDADAFGVQAEIDAIAGEERRNRRRNIFILARDEARSHFRDRDLAAEAAIHLAELKTDVTAAHHQQMPRQNIEVHHRAVGKISDAVQAGNRRRCGPAADIDEDPLGGQDFPADFDFVRRHEARMAAIDAAILEARERSLDRLVGETDHVVLARLDALHVDRDVAPGAETEVGAAPRGVHGIGAGDQGLGGRAAGIDAGAAKAIALDDRDFHARARQPPRERRSRLPGPDNDRVVVRHPVLLFLRRRHQIM